MMKDCPTPLNGAAHYAGKFVLSTPGVFIAVFTAILLIYSIMAAFVSISCWNLNEDNTTIFLIENIEKIRNGTYDYTDSKSYPVISTAAINSWLRNMELGMQRYDFGGSADNFCWVSIRTIILTSLTYRLFLLFSSLYERSIYSFVTVGKPAIFLVLLNEVLLILSLFTIFTVHVWQDKRFSHLIDVAVTTALVSFAVKMAMLIAVKKKDITSAVRAIFVATTILISQPVLENVRSFNEYVSCDQFVAKSVAYAESIALVMDFISSIFDVYDAESLMFIINCDSEDYKIYDDSF